MESARQQENKHIHTVKQRKCQNSKMLKAISHFLNSPRRRDFFIYKEGELDEAKGLDAQASRLFYVSVSFFVKNYRVIPRKI
jgi:hypothetical protein